MSSVPVNETFRQARSGEAVSADLSQTLGNSKAASLGAPKRKGPRSETAILDAAYALLTEQGLEATTIEAIALRSGVSKVTIYKWWPNRAAVVMSAFLRESPILLPYPKQLEPAQITAALIHIAESFNGNTGTIIRAIIAEGQRDPDIASGFRGYFSARREQGIKLVRAGIEAGVIREADPDAIIDLLYAPLWFRLIIGHAPLTADAVREHVKIALNGVLANNVGVST